MDVSREADEAHLAAVRERAACAKEREIGAHARAALLHDGVAELQERLNHPDLAEAARERAARARANAITAVEEQAEAEEWNRRAGLSAEWLGG